MQSPPCSALIHLLAVELRLVFVGFLSFRSIVQTTLVNQLLQENTASRWCGLTMNGTIPAHEAGDMLTSLQSAVNSAMVEPSLIVHTRLSPRPFHYVCLVYYSGLFLVLALVLTCVVLLMKSGSTDFRSGRYLAFTWSLEHTPAYTRCVYLCFACATVCVLSLCVVALVNAVLPVKYRPHHFPAISFRTLYPSLPSIAILALSGLGLFKGYPPGLTWQSKAFAEQVFDGRPLLEMFTTSNDQFGQAIANAVLQCRAGEDKSNAFVNVVHSSDNVEVLLRICEQSKPVSADNDDSLRLLA